MAREFPLQRMDTAAPPPEAPRTASAERAPPESLVDSVFADRSLDGTPDTSRWMGWRLRLLVVAALLGCVGLLMLARLLAAPLYVDASWRIDARGQVELFATGDPTLQPFTGRTLREVGGLPIDAMVLKRSPRWLIDDAARDRHATCRTGFLPAPRTNVSR